MKTKRLLYIFLIVFGSAIIGTCLYLNTLMPIITGYAAKNLCSDVFVSGRKPEKVESLDLNFSFIKYVRNKVDFKDKSVTSRFLWGKSTAVYREGFGSTLLRGVREDSLRKTTFPQEKPEYLQDTMKWPMGNIVSDSMPSGINRESLTQVAHMLIDSNAYRGTAFAFMIVYKGVPVVESYKPDFNMNTRFLSWSLAKSFVNAFVGVMVKDGKLDINKTADIDEWKNDNRSKITVNDLMQMQSGLKWNENYGNRSDVTVMLHCQKNMGRFAFEQPQEFPAGTKWYYSSGSANIVSWLIRKKFDTDSSYYDFAHDSLFEKIGIEDAVFEVDPSGTFVGSSYLYLTARDYARFGLLYLNNGVFNGQTILPEEWVKYTVTPASDSNGKYGSLFWLNRSKRYPWAPEDMYSCEGHDGQMIVIIPSRQLVMVVLGYSPASTGGMDFNRLLRDVLLSVKQ